MEEQKLTILTDAKPHVGTDKLHIALQALRQELEAAGAEYIAERVEDLGLFLLEGKM